MRKSNYQKQTLWGPFLVGLGCLLRWWALVFLSKGVGASLIVTQLGPVCAQTYATPARNKFTASRIVAGKL